MATYTPNIPVSGQTLGNSRPTINNNFSAIQTTFDANHVDFNAANAGAHTHVDLLEQGSDPNPASDICSHYSKAVSGVTEWFFQRESSGSVIQMSNGTPVASANGQTFLPGGLIMKYGSQAIVLNATSTTVTFTVAFPNNIYSLNVTVTGGFNPQIWKINDADYSVSSFKVTYSSNYNSTGHVFWTAIGN